MKKAILFLGLSLATLSVTTSCSRDDDSKKEKTDNSWAYGKWNVSHFKSSEKDNWTPASSVGWYAQFNADGSYTSKSTGIYSGTYTISGNTIKAKVGEETIIYNILERNGNNATAKMSFESEPNDFVWFKLVKQ